MTGSNLQGQKIPQSRGLLRKNPSLPLPASQHALLTGSSSMPNLLDRIGQLETGGKKVVPQENVDTF